MQTFLSVRGANLQRPHTTQGEAFAGNVSAAGARTGSFSLFAGWVALGIVGAVFGALVFAAIVAEEVAR